MVDRVESAPGPASVSLVNNPRIRSLAVQIVLVLAIVYVGWSFVENARANLAARGIATGFGFFDQTAGFGITQTLIPYSETSTYGRAFLVGLLNTLLVAGDRRRARDAARLCHRHRAAVVELPALQARRRLCRADAQSAALVPDLLLVHRRARRVARSAPERLAVQCFFPEQPRRDHAGADLRRRRRHGRHRVHRRRSCSPSRSGSGRTGAR